MVRESKRRDSASRPGKPALPEITPQRRIIEFEPMIEALASYVTRAGEKVRRERRHARQMMIFLHNSPFDPKEPYFSRHKHSDTAADQ
jgi:DNA polymerase V